MSVNWSFDKWSEYYWTHQGKFFLMKIRGDYEKGRILPRQFASMSIFWKEVSATLFFSISRCSQIQDTIFVTFKCYCKSRVISRVIVLHTTLIGKWSSRDANKCLDQTSRILRQPKVGCGVFKRRLGIQKHIHTDIRAHIHTNIPISILMYTHIYNTHIHALSHSFWRTHFW